MPKDNVEVVRAVYERWSEGDFAASVPVLDPTVEFVVHSPIPDAGTYAGVERLREYMRAFLEPWTRITIDGEEYTGAGDRVLVAVLQRGIGKGSGVATAFRYFHVWTFRDGKAIRLESIRDRAEALDAAGLRE